MEIALKEYFITLWHKYFAEAPLPITFYYADHPSGVRLAVRPKGRSCLICELAKVRNGSSVAFNAGSIACGGASRYLGFTDKLRPGFEYFLSCGNEQMEGERYIRTPEMVKELLKHQAHLGMENKYIIFKRWDMLTESDNPDVVIFFATPDVLSGLYTLANFDQTDPNTTITPFGAGCSSIVRHPYLESLSPNPKAIIGMFDPSARPCVPANTLSFAVPMKRFTLMIEQMEESFLITETWTAVKNRIHK